MQGSGLVARSGARSISVVLPAYNRADLVGETLDAVFAQTLQPDEIIVVDDGSTDATPDVLAGFSNRVRVVRIANSGEFVARNAGLAVASGDLVAFCDSDDLWRPSFLATMARLWQVEPRLSAAYSNFQVVRDGVWLADSKFDAAPAGYWSSLRRVGDDAGVFDEPIVPLLLDYQPFFPSCMMVDRASFVAAGGWDTTVSRLVGGDFATTLRMAELPPLGVVRAPLVGIRKHAGNFSGDVQAMNHGDAAVLDHVLRQRPSLARYAGAIRASAARRRCAALEMAFARGDLAAVRSINTLLPPSGRSGRVQVKVAVAALPSPIAGLSAWILQRLGSWVSRQRLS